jgi:hypothetical protein
MHLSSRRLDPARMGASGVPGGRRREFVDGHQFDALTRHLTSIRFTRGSALRGMAAGALTLVGMTRVADEASAGKKKKVCHCGDTAGATCSTLAVKKKQRRMHLTEHQCDYMGACRSNIDACAAAPILVNVGRLGDSCSTNSDCGASSGLECVANLCVPLDLDKTCTNDGECSTGRCEGNVCVLCPEASTCETTTGGTQCCTGLATCDPTSHVCVLI